MGLQSLVRGLIISHSPLLDIIPAARWLPAGAINADNVPERLFAAMRWGTTTPGVGAMRRHTLAIWVHDDLGTYSDINSVLTLLDARLSGVAHVREEGGSEILQIDGEPSVSGDLYDPGYRTITRNITFNVIGKGL